MAKIKVTAAATGVVTLALAGLAVATLGGVLSLASAIQRAERAQAEVAPYLELRRTVAEEAMAEAAYRRAPSESARGRLERAITAVEDTIADARAVVDKGDQATLSYLLTLNSRYADEVRGSLDVQRTDEMYDRVAGPALDAIGTLVDAAITGHQAELARESANQTAALRRLEIVVPSTFVIAFLLLSGSWRVMLRDQFRLRAAAEVNERRAVTDPLTGLHNRAGLDAAAHDLFDRAGTTVSVLLVDLDRFKPVNDTWGHHAGDRVLAEVADRLRGAVRASEVVARIGGDEFAVLVQGADGAVPVAERIVRSLTEPYDLGEAQVRIGASVGVGRRGTPEDDFATVLRAADAALYCAKRAGGGVVRTGPDDPEASVLAEVDQGVGAVAVLGQRG